MLSEPHPPFSLNKVALGGPWGPGPRSAVRVADAQMSMAQPTWTPGLGTQAREWRLCCSAPVAPRGSLVRPASLSSALSGRKRFQGGTRTAVPSKATGYTPNTIGSEPRRAGPTVTPSPRLQGRLCRSGLRALTLPVGKRRSGLGRTERLGVSF